MDRYVLISMDFNGKLTKEQHSRCTARSPDWDLKVCFLLFVYFNTCRAYRHSDISLLSLIHKGGRRGWHSNVAVPKLCIALWILLDIMLFVLDSQYPDSPSILLLIPYLSWNNVEPREEANVSINKMNGSQVAAYNAAGGGNTLIVPWFRSKEDAIQELV